MTLREQVGRALEWLRTVVKSWPALAAGITVVLAAAGEQVVPLLPDSWAVRALAVLAFLGAAVGAISLAVARLTPVLFPENVGVLAPAPRQLRGPGVPHSSHVRVTSAEPDPESERWEADKERPLPPIGPQDYPPEAGRLPHRRG